MTERDTPPPIPVNVLKALTDAGNACVLAGCTTDETLAILAEVAARLGWGMRVRAG
jgi:hypothetical protein